MKNRLITFSLYAIGAVIVLIWAISGDSDSANRLDARRIIGELTLRNADLHLLDSNETHDLIIKPGSDLTADRTLTVVTGDSDTTLILSIYSQSAEPNITNDSYAFWKDTDDGKYYLILDVGGVQKKLELT